MAALDPLLAAWTRLGVRDTDLWARTVPGPRLADVEARLSAVPAPFVADEAAPLAIVRDCGIGGTFAAEALLGDARAAKGAAIAAWLIGSEDLYGPLDPPLAAGAAPLLVDALSLRLAPTADPLTWIGDAQRREEAARWSLLALGYRPAGEGIHDASSLLSSLDSLRRDAALAAVLEEQTHRQAVAAKLAEARAREATARYTRE